MFHPVIEVVLPEAIRIPELFAKAIKIYENYTKIEGIQYLLELPQLDKIKSEKNLLNNYFERLPRVKDLSTVEEYASLSLNWINLFLEEKIERDESLSEEFL